MIHSVVLGHFELFVLRNYNFHVRMNVIPVKCVLYGFAYISLKLLNRNLHLQMTPPRSLIL